MTSTLALPAELTIYTASELRTQWLAWLDAGAADDAPAQADAAAVTEVDAAGVQLLLALRQALARRQRRLVLRSAGPALRDACAALGLQALLADGGAAGDPA